MYVCMFVFRVETEHCGRVFGWECDCLKCAVLSWLLKLLLHIPSVHDKNAEAVSYLFL